MPIHTFSSFLSGDNVPLRLTQREALETRCALFVMSATASESKFSSLEREREGELCYKKIHPRGSSQAPTQACKIFKETLNMHIERIKDACTVTYMLSYSLLIKTVLLCFQCHDLFMCVCSTVNTEI